MDQLVWPLLIYAIFPSFILGHPACLIDNCGNEYQAQMGRNRIEQAEPSVEYCEILVTYQKCIRANAGRCRGNILYHTMERATKTLADQHCPLNGKPRPRKTDDATGTGNRTSTTTAEPDTPIPAGCRYTGRNVFRHCGFFGDPHLKTFRSQYQTCRLQGTWYLINNPFMSVALTNEYVDEARIATAPTKIVIVIKSRSTPCTLEQRYEANSSEGRLPSTFVDGTDRPGADETVSLKFRRNERENYETVEIRMKYVATRLVVRRFGKYLAFSAQLPEEVIKSSLTYDEAGSAVELCTAGCPAHELLRNLRPPARSGRHSMDREAALRECLNLQSLGMDFGNNLTGSFLEWCVFDLMTVGLSHDFITAAHVAQADAHGMDPSTATDDAETSLWQTEGVSGTQSAGGTPSVMLTLAVLQLFFSLQLPFRGLQLAPVAITRS